VSVIAFCVRVCVFLDSVRPKARALGSLVGVLLLWIAITPQPRVCLALQAKGSRGLLHNVSSTVLTVLYGFTHDSLSPSKKLLVGSREAEKVHTKTDQSIAVTLTFKMFVF